MTQSYDDHETIPARREIQLSWKRSILNGVDPREPRLEDTPTVELDPSCRLMSAAGPVLEQMADKLSGTSYSLLLADRDCRLMYRWFDDSAFESTLDRLGLRTGACIGEETVGTNALGTAVETRRGITVHGAEHFLEPFKRFSCYGHPILNPVTRRLEGVLDITGSADDANPLLAPFLVRAVEDIELRLLDQAKASERALLTAFQSSSQHRGRPVAALGEDMVLTNKAALDLLSPSDYGVMRVLMDELGRAPERCRDMTLASGTTVEVHLVRVPGAGEGTLFYFEPAPDRTRRTNRVGWDEPATRGPVLVHGAPGTGRSTEARSRAGEAAILNCADIAVDGEAAWGGRLCRALGQGGTLCLDNIEHLPDALVSRVVRAVTAGTGPRLVLTSAPLDELSPAHQGLAAMVTDHVELRPLRDRGSEIAELAQHMIRDLDPDIDIRFVPSVIETLANRPWPGNLHELRAVVSYVIEHRRAGDVTVMDLPEDYRTTAARRPLAGRERAERDAIVSALQVNGGNKVRAARDLGISRTTLYSRMKALNIKRASR